MVAPIYPNQCIVFATLTFEAHGSSCGRGCVDQQGLVHNLLRVNVRWQHAEQLRDAPALALDLLEEGPQDEEQVATQDDARDGKSQHVQHQHSAAGEKGTGSGSGGQRPKYGLLFVHQPSSQGVHPPNEGRTAAFIMDEQNQVWYASVA